MFRLPLTLFEHYLWQEDRPAFPCWMLFRFRFRGRFDRPRLERAWAATAARHPLLAAVIRPGSWGRRPHWEPAPNGPALVAWASTPEGDAWPVLGEIDLTREAGFRLLALESPDRTDLVVHAHHAPLDGTGVLNVIQDLLLHYVRESGGDVALPDLRPESLRRRARLAATFWERLKLLPMQLAGLAYALPLLRRVVAPMCPHVPVAAGIARPWPTVLTRRYGPEVCEKIRATAQQTGTSTNDVLMRDLLAALGVWRAQHAPGAPTDWIRLVIPMGLRRPADRVLPAANVIGLVGIDRQARGLGNRERLLRRAREDLNLIRQHRLAHVFHAILWLQRLRPGGIGAYCRQPVCRSTLVMTNLGQIFPAESPLLDASQRLTVPGAVLEQVEAVAPLRPGTLGAVAILFYDGHLQLVFSYDERILRAAQAEDFLRAFEEQLALSCEQK